MTYDPEHDDRNAPEYIAHLEKRVATLEEALRLLAGSLPDDGFRGDDWFGVNTYWGESEIKRFRELIGTTNRN